MNEFNIYNLEINDLSVKVQTNYEDKENKSIIVNFEGIIFAEKTEELKKYFELLHNKILEHNITHIIIDFYNLEMIDRDGFTEIAHWFINANNVVSDSDKYKITLLYDRLKKWQKNLFTTLKNLFPDLITLEEM
ncbi:MAG: hypothetical protein ACOCV8_00625 [Spirochaetota bacterium]